LAAKRNAEAKYQKALKAAGLDEESFEKILQSKDYEPETKEISPNNDGTKNEERSSEHENETVIVKTIEKLTSKKSSSTSSAKSKSTKSSKKSTSRSSKKEKSPKENDDVKEKSSSNEEKTFSVKDEQSSSSSHGLKNSGKSIENKKVAESVQNNSKKEDTLPDYEEMEKILVPDDIFND